MGKTSTKILRAKRAEDARRLRTEHATPGRRTNRTALRGRTTTWQQEIAERRAAAQDKRERYAGSTIPTESLFPAARPAHDSSQLTFRNPDGPCEYVGCTVKALDYRNPPLDERPKK